MITEKIHFGHLIKQHLKAQDNSVSWLARLIEYDRSDLRKQLEHCDLHPELLTKISIAMKTDYFSLYSEFLKEYECIEVKQTSF
jgi:hypothetical protein